MNILYIQRRFQKENVVNYTNNNTSIINSFDKNDNFVNGCFNNPVNVSSNDFFWFKFDIYLNSYVIGRTEKHH